MEKVPVEEQYEMCGLFKQSTFGDIDIKCKYTKMIFLVDFCAQSNQMIQFIRDANVDSHSEGHVLGNCQAWQSKRGLSKPEAIRQYVTKSEAIVSAFKQ